MRLRWTTGKCASVEGLEHIEIEGGIKKLIYILYIRLIISLFYTIHHFDGILGNHYPGHFDTECGWNGEPK